VGGVNGAIIDHEVVMPFVIDDETLRAMGMDEREALVEIACRLFDAGKLSFGHAAAFAKIDEDQMYREIEKRNIPRYRYTAEHLAQDIEAMRQFNDQKATK
jgi:predicted HTH domain antitoxin